MASNTLDFEKVYGEFIPAGNQLASPPPGEEVVISGISGHFPESAGLYELKDNLRDLGDLITDDDRRWKAGTSHTPHRLGKVPHPEKFDASFFEVDANTSYLADPIMRMQLETIFEAIADAGVHPHSLRGKRVAVITSGIFSESEVLFFRNEEANRGFIYCNRPTQAGVIAHWLGVHGPAYLADTACSSSMFGLDAAYQFIRTGKCDAAIVSGANFCLHEYSTGQFNSLGVLSQDGCCRSFDDDGSGYVRSEVVGAIFLQKAKDARRMYGKLVHIQTNCDGYKQEGITYPSGNMQELLLRRFYSECGVDPYSINYIEAHGTGTKVGDPEELRAIDNVFASKRTRENPLLIGSVKSNLGHSEPLSGIASIAKVIISIESGTIPANMHFKRARRGAVGLEEGRMKVVAKPESYVGGPVPINSFGFGGSNSHTLLAPNTKKKVNRGAPKDGLPRLVTVSGRTPEAVKALLTQVESMKPVDAEYTRLLHELFIKHIPGHLYRGYTVVPAVSTSYGSTVQVCPREKKISVKLFLSLGETTCNPAVIGSLMQFKVFSSTMNECFQTLVLEGIDLLFAAFSTDGEEWALRKSITTSVQIALINLLRTVGVKIDEFIGNCPAKNYAEGAYTIEEAVFEAFNMDVEDRKARGISSMLSKDLEHTGSTVNCSEYPNAKITNNIEASVSQLKELVVLEISPESMLSQSLNVFNNCHALLQLLGRLYIHGMDLHLTELYPSVEYPVSCGTPMIAPFIKWDHSEKWFVATGRDYANRQEWDFTIEIKMAQAKYNFLYGHVIDGRNLFPATGYIITALQAFCTQNSINLSTASIVCENVRFKRATNVPKDGALRFRITIGRGSHTFEIMEGGSVTVTGQFEIQSAPMISDGLPLPTPAEGLVMDEADIYKELRLRGYNYSGVFRSLKSLDTSGCVGKIAWKENWVAYMDNMLQAAIFQKDTRNLYVPVRIKRIVMDFSKHSAAVKNCGKDGALPVYGWKHLNLVRSGGFEICGLAASPIPRRITTADPVVESYGFVPYRGQTSLSFEDLLRVSIHIALENNPLVRKVKAVEVPSENQDSYLSTEVASILAELPVIQGNLTVLDDAPSTEIPASIQFEKHGLNEEKDCLLVLGTGVLSKSSQKFLGEAVSVLSDGGFIISKEHLNSKIEEMNDSMTVVMDCVASNMTERVVLLKKNSSAAGEVQIINVDEDDYNWLPRLKSCMKNAQQKVVLVSQGNNASGILGLTNCLRVETDGSCLRCFFIKDTKAPTFNPHQKFYQDQIALNLAMNVYENGLWGSYRHLPLKPPQSLKSAHALNAIAVTGDLSSTVWQQGFLDPVRDINEPGFVHVYYSAFNFRDIMTATGKLSADVVNAKRYEQNLIQGFEFSGRDKDGRRVMGISGGGAIGTMVIAPKPLVLDVPDNWSLADAATVPCVYLTVVFSFYSSGGTPQKGQSILIHAGSGGIGQAAINYCLFHGCNVFTTVGTKEKKEFLLKTFPQLIESHIGNSRDTSFEQMVMNETQLRGVDYVLNSLAEDKLLASVRCLAKGGKFLEIGKFDMASDNEINSEFAAREASFHSIFLDNLFNYPHERLVDLRNDMMKCMKEGAVKPLIKTVLNVDQVEDAYRLMAAGKHMGKVILKIRPEEKQKICLPAKFEMEGQPRVYCDPQHTYIIIGGLGGFGLELADWLILRRARKLVLTSRSGLTNGYQQSRIRTWESYGVTVVILTDDVKTEAGCYKLLEKANQIGPVGGIFNLAVDLHDAILENQTIETFQLSAGPKAVATRFLDKLSQKMCPRLSLFVVFSSVSSGRGNAGQTNYGWSNSVMERICEERRSKGLPAVAIQWGAVGDVGLVAKMQGDDKEFVIGGTLPQKIMSCLSLLDSLLLQNCPVVASMVVAEKRMGLSQTAGVLEYVANILGIKNLKTVNHSATLAELGMDSMMAVEIKQAVEVTFEVFLTPEEVRNLTLTSLVELSKRSAEESDNSNSNAAQTSIEAASGQLKLSPIIKLNGMKSCKVVNQQCLPGRHYVYVLPGIEQDSEAMRGLSSRLNAASLKCFQAGYYENNEYHSVHEIAQYFLSYILDDLPKGQFFALVAFSFGGLVALELIAQLEDRGYKGCVVLIDSSPKYLRKSIKQLGEEYDSIWLADLLVQMGCNQGSAYEFQEKAVGLEWSQKLEIAMALFQTPEIQQSIEVRLFFTTIYKRLNDVLNYKCSFKNIKSAVILIKTSDAIITEIDPAYGLREICEKIVGIHTVAASHYTVVDDARTAEIINEELGK